MAIVKLGAALAAGTLALLALQTSAVAGSAETSRFLANVSPNIDFLDQSSRFALTNSKNSRLMDFAKTQAREQTLAANALDDWRQTGDTLQTGRSAAVTDARLPLGQEELDSLEGLNGRDFDDQYRAKQRDALLQVEADYQDYIARGDDPLLLALASRELPKVRQRLALLGKI